MRIATLLTVLIFSTLTMGADPPDDESPRPAEKGVATTAVTAEVDPELARELRAIARDYRGFGRVDDLLRFAPWLCRIPPPSTGRISDAAEPTPHGRKLYFVFAKDRDAYLTATAPEQADVKKATPPGQVVVKESFTAVPCSPDEEPYVRPSTRASPAKDPDGAGPAVTAAVGAEPGALTGCYTPYAERDGERYRAGELHGLFVMLKREDDAKDADAGWIYATITADGTITGAGRMASCMKCHEQAPHGRLFGLPEAELKVDALKAPQRDG